MISNLRARGFSIVELMVAVTIGLALTAAVGTLFSISNKTYRVADSVGVMQETGRAALALLDRDLRMAGYRGCNSNSVKGSSAWVNTINSPTTYLNRLDRFVEGFEASASTWTPALPTEVSSATPAPAAGRDVLTVRVAASEPIALAGTMASGTADVDLVASTGLAAGQNVIVADCAQTSAFQVTGITGTTLSHASGGNSTNDLTRAFGVDAEVVPFSTVSYYVAPSINQPSGTENSLWRRTGTAAPEEVAENVENFQVLYGEDLNSDYYADKYVPADAVTDFTRVVAVQVTVLLRGQRDFEAQTIEPYTFNGASVTPTDKRLRRVYTANIQLRNRTL